MKSKTVMIQAKAKDAQQVALVPVFNAIAIQKEITLNMAPLFKEQVRLQQFFQEHAVDVQNLLKALNHAFEGYRRTFEIFGNLQEQILRIQEERAQVMASVAQIVTSWKSFSLRIPTNIIVEHLPVRPRIQEVALREDDLIERITNRVIERVEKRAEKALKLITTEVAIVPLSTGTCWESVTFAFIDEFNVEIHHGKKFIGQFSREDLKFVKMNTGDKRPNKAWALLLSLSVFQNMRSEKPTVNELLRGGKHFKNKDALHATMSILSKHMEQIFGINERPFFNYSEYAYYRPKFILLPPTILRGNGEIFIAPKKKGFQENGYLPNEDY